MQQQTKHIVIDPGRRLVKAAWIDEDTAAIATVPSVAGIGDTDVGRLSLGDLGERPSSPEPYQVTVNGLTYVVGEGTGRYAEPTEGLNLLWPHNGPLVKALLYSVIHCLLGPGEHRVVIHVAAPVPPAPHTAAFTGWASGRHVFTVDGNRITLDVTEIRAHPGPLGPFYAWGLDDQGEWEHPDTLRGQVGVLDIGYANTRLSVFGGGDLTHQSQGDFGTGLVTGILQEHIENEHDRSLGLFAVDELLYAAQPRIHTPQGSVGIAGLVDLMRPMLTSRILIFADAHDVARFDRVLLTGGGAGLLRERLSDLHRQTIPLDRPITATVRGLMAFIHRSQSERSQSEYRRKS